MEQNVTTEEQMDRKMAVAEKEKSKIKNNTKLNLCYGCGMLHFIKDCLFKNRKSVHRMLGEKIHIANSSSSIIKYILF